MPFITQPTRVSFVAQFTARLSIYSAPCIFLKNLSMSTWILLGAVQVIFMLTSFTWAARVEPQLLFVGDKLIPQENRESLEWVDKPLVWGLMTIPYYRERMMSLDPSTSIPSVFCWATFLSKDLGFNIWFPNMKGTWFFNTLKGMARSCEKWCLKDIERLCWELHVWRHYQLFHDIDQFWGWFEVVNLQVFRCFKNRHNAQLMDHEFIQARSSRDIRRIQKDNKDFFW